MGSIWELERREFSYVREFIMWQAWFEVFVVMWHQHCSCNDHGG